MKSAIIGLSKHLMTILPESGTIARGLGEVALELLTLSEPNGYHVVSYEPPIALQSG